MNNYPSQRKSKVTQSHHNKIIHKFGVTCDTFGGYKEVCQYSCDTCGYVWSQKYRTRNLFCSKCTKKRIGSGNQKMSHSELLEKLKSKNITLKPIDTCIAATSKIRFLCDKCGYVWSVIPSSILYGKGCIKCANKHKSKTMRRYFDRPTKLYVIYFPKHKIHKIGITFRKISERYEKETERYVVVYNKLFPTGKLAFDREQLLIKHHEKFQTTGEFLKNGGKYECTKHFYK